MRKSQEDEDIEKIFQKSRMTTEAPIVKQEVDQEKPKELENTMYRSAKGWIETLCSAAETAGHISSEILTREDFLNYNELYSKRIEEYDRKITELEAERQNLQTAPNAYPFLDVYRKYRKLEKITRPMIVELIEKIEVYEGNRVEITFRFHDEIADLLEELHQKQQTQHEVSA